MQAGRPRGGRGRGPRRGALLTEVVLGVGLLAIVLANLLTLFRTGVRQTQGVRSRVVARALADWALAQARAFVASGVAMPEDRVALTSDVRSRFRGTASQLQQLRVLRSMAPEGPGGKLYRILVEVSWADPGIEGRRELVVYALERGET